jgi:hypothetical protein
MIPAKVVHFLEERASIGIAGTRDGNLVPCGHRVCGWQVGAAGRTLTALIPDSSVPRLLEDVRDHGPIAATFEEIGTHETYQVKGRYVSHRPVGPADIEIANRARERFAKGLRSQMPDEQMAALVKASIPAPGVAVEIEVQEVFVQTPGPGAGARIAPPPDAERSAT